MILIEVLVWLENVTPHLLRFKIEQGVSVIEEKMVDNKMLCFRCKSEIKGELRLYEIKFELAT